MVEKLKQLADRPPKETVYLKATWFEKLQVVLSIALLLVFFLFFVVGSNPARDAVSEVKKTELLICKLYNDLDLPLPIECVVIVEEKG